MELLILPILICAGFAVGWFCKKRNRQLEAGLYCMDRFYHSADALANDDRTPEHVLQLIAFISSSLRSRTLVWSVLFCLLRGDFKKVTNNEKVREISSEIDSLPVELRKHLSVSVVAGVLATTYNNFIVGMILRRVTLFGVELSKRSQDQKDSHRAEQLAEGMYTHDMVKGYCG